MAIGKKNSGFYSSIWQRIWVCRIASINGYEIYPLKKELCTNQ